MRVQHGAKSGENIVTQGDDGDYFYMLESGSADAFVSSAGQRPKLVMR